MTKIDVELAQKACPSWRFIVLSGPRRGARATLYDSEMVSAGFDNDNDIVIRDPAVRGVRAEITLSSSGASFKLIEGSAVIAGMPLLPGQTVTVPPYMPVKLGTCFVALGPPSKRHWAACVEFVSQMRRAEHDSSSNAPSERLSSESSSSESPASDASASESPEDADEGLTSPRALRLADAWRRVTKGAGTQSSSRGAKAVIMVLVVLALALIGIALLSMWPKVTAVPVVNTSKAKAALLASLENDKRFGDVYWISGTGALPSLGGYVDRDIQVQELARRIQELGQKVSLQVVSGEQLTRQVSDVLRVNGISGEVKYLRAGVVKLTAQDVMPERLAKAVEAVRRDVPRLDDLRVDATAPKPVPPVRRTPNDPGKRVVNVRYGPNGFVTSADGARYFVGALLPTGHRIVKITNDAVIVELDGSTSQLTF